LKIVIKVSVLRKRMVFKNMTGMYGLHFYIDS